MWKRKQTQTLDILHWINSKFYYYLDSLLTMGFSLPLISPASITQNKRSLVLCARVRACMRACEYVCVCFYILHIFIFWVHIKGRSEVMSGFCGLREWWISSLRDMFSIGSLLNKMWRAAHKVVNPQSTRKKGERLKCVCGCNVCGFEEKQELTEAEKEGVVGVICLVFRANRNPSLW